MGRAFKVVVLGGGTAAGYAASEFVKLGIHHGDLCIISEESVAPYGRPALSKGYLLIEGAAWLSAFHTCVGTGEEQHMTKWYKDNGIELVLGTRVKAADVRARTLRTAAGETISYKFLVIATGARVYALVPLLGPTGSDHRMHLVIMKWQVLKLEEFGVTGADAHNVCYLRDVQDAAHLVD
ncbi:unnamed protein product [Sphagnum tenellum]